MKIRKKLGTSVKEDGAVTIAFFGDSVTHGYFESINNMHGATDSEAVYHNILRKKLNGAYPHMPINIINAGIGGESASGATTRLERDVINHCPDLCVVMFGLNDINGTCEGYVGALEQIFDALADAKIETIFMTPNMLNTYVDDSLTGGLREYAGKTAQYQTSGRMDSYIDAARTLAQDKNIEVCDCYKLWKKMYNEGTDTTQLLANKINHPKREMHELFANELFKTIIQDGGEDNV